MRPRLCLTDTRVRTSISWFSAVRSWGFSSEDETVPHFRTPFRGRPRERRRMRRLRKPCFQAPPPRRRRPDTEAAATGRGQTPRRTDAWGFFLEAYGKAHVFLLAFMQNSLKRMLLHGSFVNHRFKREDFFFFPWGRVRKRRRGERNEGEVRRARARLPGLAAGPRGPGVQAPFPAALSLAAWHPLTCHVVNKDLPMRNAF